MKLEMLEIPVTQLFIAGVFAIVFTEVVKWVFGITESDIGLHSSHNGELIQARIAAIIYSVVILVSNIVAFYAYELGYEEIAAYSVPSMAIDAGLIMACVVVIYGYLKLNHYSRE